MHIDRRRFLQGCAAGAAGLQLVAADARAGVRLFASAPVMPGELLPTLVLVQLAGGNDGLSTVVPYADDVYQRSRKSIGHLKKDVLALDDYRGLHARLGGLKRWYDAGKLAIVEGCGYPEPNRSHFQAFEIWHTADVRGRTSGEGWIGRLCAAAFASDPNPNLVVHVGGSTPYSLYSARRPAIAFTIPEAYRWVGDPKDLEVCSEGDADAASAKKRKDGDAKGPHSPLEYLREVQREAQSSSREVRLAAQRYKPRKEYPQDPFAYALRCAAAMIQGRVGSRVISVELAGFDTHNGQRGRHDSQMRRLDEGLSAFLDDLAGQEAGKRTVVMAFSEFGRRVAENNSQGTDHGTAGPMFVLGDSVKGGLYGKHPNLENLNEGDMRFTTDFRSVYATVIERWFDVQSGPILRDAYPKLGFLA